MLHTTTGFISAAFGFAMVDLLNRNKPQHFKLSPVFLAPGVLFFPRRSVCCGVF